MKKQADQQLIERFKKLVTEEAAPEFFFELLDDVAFEYAIYVMNDSGICGGSDIYSEKVYFLKALRDLFKQFPKNEGHDD